jgi:hypothetical protein
MMEEKQQKRHELLANWSKWLITINVFAATGCIAGLKTAGMGLEKTGVYFFAAIVSFGLSIVCATLFVFLLAGQDAGDTRKETPFIWLAKTQWGLFTLGLLFVLIWAGFLSGVFQ